MLTVLACGCANSTRIDTLERRIDELQRQVADLQSSYQGLERDRTVDQMLKDFESIAYLTPGDGGYSIVQTDLGRMTVSLDNIQQYANGSRVTLRFGNPTSATINGAKATLEWGAVDSAGTPRNATAKKRDVSFPQSLRAGAWTSVPIVLDAVPPTDLGFVRVRELSQTGITLLR